MFVLSALLGHPCRNYLVFTGCVLFDYMMSQDGLEMPLASWHPMVSNARLVLGTSRRACWSWYRREGVLVLREASHYFRLSVF